MSVPYAEVIGDPVAQSKSPLIHEFWLGKLGLPGEYCATRITADELPAYLSERQADPHWRGCNVTMPLKLAVRELVRHRGDPSFPPEPLNLVTRAADGGLEGHALDTSGFVAALLAWRGNNPGRPGPELAGRSGPALVLGAGGAARAAVWGLAHLGYAPIWIRNRTAARAEAVARDHETIGARVLPPSAAPPALTLVVNASALGMTGHPEPDLDLDGLVPDTLVFDLVTAPAETALLKQARARGLPTIDGLSMLVEQARPSFRHLFGAEAPREHDVELRALLLA